MTRRLEETVTVPQLAAQVVKLRADVDALLALVDGAPEPSAGDELTPPLARSWRAGVAVAVGDLRSFGGVVYQVRQAHTTQGDWTPPATPALWSRWRDGESTPDAPQEWAAGLAVTVGEVFTYAGTSYAVVQAHTTQLGWEPPAAPALWSEVGS